MSRPDSQPPVGMRDPSARIHPAARIAPDVEVGPGVVVEADVVVGARSRILTGSVLHDGTRLGARVRVGPYAVVGGEPMDSHFQGEASFVVVEDEVSLREFVTVNRGTGEGTQTHVGARTLVMSYAHVSHNTQVGTACVLTTGVQLGGHSVIGDHAVLASNVLVHQFGKVGAYAMVGGGSGVNRDVLPFHFAHGNPVRHVRLNRVGLLRNGIDGDRYHALERALRALRHRDDAALERLAEGNEDVRLLLRFRRDSQRGVARFLGSG